MNKEIPTTGKATVTAEVAEPCNLRIEVIGNRVKVGKAICSGDVPFPVTKSQADALVSAGLARIIGVF